MDGKINGLMNGWMHEWMDGLMVELTGMTMAIAMASCQHCV